MAPFDVPDAVDEAIALLADRLRKAHVLVRRTLSPSERIAHGDRALFQQVVINLAGNAIEAMRGSSGARTLSITTRSQADAFMEIEVADTGEGIPPEQVARIFDPLLQHKAGRHGHGACHLPLRREAHGGTLGVDTGPTGTRFFFSFPGATTHDTPFRRRSDCRRTGGPLRRSGDGSALLDHVCGAGRGRDARFRRFLPHRLHPRSHRAGMGPELRPVGHDPLWRRRRLHPRRAAVGQRLRCARQEAPDHIGHDHLRPVRRPDRLRAAGLVGADRRLAHPVGFGLAASATPVLTLVVEVTPTRHRTRVGSLFMVFSSLGILVAALSSGLLIETLGWRGVALLGFMPLVPALLTALFVPESLRWLVAVGRISQAMALVGEPGQAGAAAPQVEKGRGLIRSLGDLYERPRIFWQVVIVNAAALTVVFGYYLWGPTIMSAELGRSVGGTALYFVIISGCGILGRLSTAVVVPFTGRRPLGIVLALLAAAALACVSCRASAPWRACPWRSSRSPALPFSARAASPTARPMPSSNMGRGWARGRRGSRRRRRRASAASSGRWLWR